jgi:hypothetical protein
MKKTYKGRYCQLTNKSIFGEHLLQYSIPVELPLREPSRKLKVLTIPRSQ